jgi:hypothetical protein
VFDVVNQRLSSSLRPMVTWTAFLILRGLELAAISGKVIVTHDRTTVIDHFRDRLKQGRSSPAYSFPRKVPNWRSRRVDRLHLGAD